MSHISANLVPCPVHEIGAHMRRAAEQAWKESGDAVPSRILRASVLLKPVPPLDWLTGAPDQLRFYGSMRDRTQPLEVGGVGIADEALWKSSVPYDEVFAQLRATLDVSSNSLRYYGGFRFDQNRTPDPDWTSFGACRFVVPRFELRTAPMGSQLAFHFKASEVTAGIIDEAVEQLERMTYAEREWDDRFPPPRTRVDLPDRDGWRRNVEAALADFASGELEKIVLARKASFEFGGHLDPVTLLHRLKSATPECFHFCYMPSNDLAFIGASPERLYKREGRAVETEAVAGTRMRSDDPVEDDRLGSALLESEKDRREHGYVRDGLSEGMTPLCDQFEMDESPSLLKLARGQHLFSGVKGTLREGVGDEDILTALHPTPALGGHPTDRAIQRIAELERFDRGWYAAPVGWVSRDAAEFAVAIRCGLVRPDSLSLFSGAGLVEGSTPEQEWEEIELKIRDFIKVLTGT